MSFLRYSRSVLTAAEAGNDEHDAAVESGEDDVVVENDENDPKTAMRACGGGDEDDWGVWEVCGYGGRVRRVFEFERGLIVDTRFRVFVGRDAHVEGALLEDGYGNGGKWELGAVLKMMFRGCFGVPFRNIGLEKEVFFLY